jgi:hypothetical protein
VTPGKTYTISCFMKSSRKYAIAKLSIKAYDAAKTNLGAKHQCRMSNTSEGIWQETGFLYTVTEGQAYLAVSMTRIEGSDDTGDVWVDDFYIGENIGFKQPPTPKGAYNGATVQIDALGNYKILENGVWKDFFPFGVYADPSKDLTYYKNHGFNTVLVLPEYRLQRVKEAGLKAMCDFSRFIDPQWAQSGDIDQLASFVRSIKADPDNQVIFTWYYDNEFYTKSSLAKQLTDIIKINDVNSSGIRNRPIIPLPC